MLENLHFFPRPSILDLPFTLCKYQSLTEAFRDTKNFQLNGKIYDPAPLIPHLHWQCFPQKQR